jgi:hypothetical protein
MKRKTILISFLGIFCVFTAGFYFQANYVWIRYKGKTKPFKIEYVEKRHLLKGDREFTSVKGVVGPINSDVSICNLSFKGFNCYNGKIWLIVNPLSDNDDCETEIKLNKP